MTAGYSKLRNQLFCRLFITAAVIIAIVFLDCNFFNEARADNIIGEVWDKGIRWFKDKVYAAFFKPNVHCPKQDTLAERYSMCFACMTMKVLLESFMTACSQSYYIVKEAGVKLLLIGTMLWVPFTVIKQVSSLTDPEAPSIVNELGKFTFKVIVAYMFITSGISVLVNLVINPVLATGADFANAFLDSGLPSPTEDEPTYVYNGPSDIISADVLNKIMTFTEGISRRVAINMVLGNGLTCFSWSAGFKIVWLEIPDIWLWLCGAVIWFVGLLLVMFVSYYLLDICFKIGFAILALPIVIGLWPFDITKNKVSVCFSIIISAAATYAFLSLITVFAMVMIDQGIGGVDKLFEAFEADNIPYVQNKFSLTGGPFIIFCICFIYAVKLIGGNQQYTKKFFPDKIFKGYGPMHEYAAKIADSVKNAAVAPVKLAGDIAVHQTGRAAGGLVKGVMHAATGNKFKQGQNIVGNSAKAAGSVTSAAGSGMKGAGAGMEAAGGAAEAAGAGLKAAGGSMKAAGAAMQAIPVVGNVAGAVVGAAGTAVSAAGTAVSAAGKAAKAAGKATKAAGNAVKQTGQTIKKAGDHVKKMAATGAKSSKEDKEKEEEKKRQEAENKPAESQE
ncbi:MAG: hypothetical protein J6L86_03690 [Alphaproteobacteria bacterium]|nr:hypothetical protein [Alphaproteobacteria bacterium]